MAIIGGGTAGQVHKREGDRRCEIFCGSAIKSRSEWVRDFILLDLLVRGCVKFLPSLAYLFSSSVALPGSCLAKRTNLTTNYQTKEVVCTRVAVTLNTDRASFIAKSPQEVDSTENTRLIWQFHFLMPSPKDSDSY